MWLLYDIRCRGLLVFHHNPHFDDDDNRYWYCSAWYLTGANSYQVWVQGGQWFCGRRGGSASGLRERKKFTSLQPGRQGGKEQRAGTFLNKAVYTTTPFAGSWAGAVMIWAGACSNTNFPTLKIPKNAKKQCVKDRGTDRPTDTVTYRSRCPRQKAGCF